MTTYTENFTRADSSSSAGPNWTNRLNTYGVASNAAKPISSNVYSAATYATTSGSDDMTVTVTVAAFVGAAIPVGVALGFDTGGTGVLGLFIGSGTAAIYSTSANWDQASATSRASGSLTLATSDTIGLKRVGNVYTLQHNGTDTTITWTDGSSVVPRDSSHRLAGISAQNFIGEYFPITSFSLTDTTGGGGPTVTGSFFF